MPKKHKRGRKSQDARQESEEEVIRCVCGAAEQDEDSGEPWIACDKCGAWQHNVCMGMSVFSDELPKHYFCEQCSPQDHVELLEGIEKGEKLWDGRRARFEVDKTEQKRRKGGRKPKNKRLSDAKDTDDVKEETPDTQLPSSTAPDDDIQDVDVKAEVDLVDTQGSIGKRKSRSSEGHESDVKSPVQKIRRLTEPDDNKVTYQPPADILLAISDLPEGRSGPATALMKSLIHALELSTKAGEYQPESPAMLEADAERMALEIERALHDENPKEYRAQTQRLVFNIKKNQELCSGLLRQTLSPVALAVMKSEQLASSQFRKEISEIKAQVEKQSILIATDGPRMRRTHKGEEVVEPEAFIATEEEPSLNRRPSMRESLTALKLEPAATPPKESKPVYYHHQHQHQQPPKQHEFDIKSVFSTVVSPTAIQTRQASGQMSSGPGFDPEVDRLLQDDSESPPYSPVADGDPDIVWRGNLAMSSVADFPAVAKFMGGANLNTSIGLPWTTLIPKRLAVAGRIDEQKAIEYLCGLRYSEHTDIVVASVSPSSPASQHEFQALVDYFTSKQRYGVVGDKGVGNVRDTYLVPLPPGDSNCPEFMLNLMDNSIPKKRSESMLLVVFVYRNDPMAFLQSSESPNAFDAQPSDQTTAADSSQVLAPDGPAFSPTSPHFSPADAIVAAPIGSTEEVYAVSLTPVEEEARKQRAHEAGCALAAQVLGPFIASPTIKFLLPQAYQMRRKEWEVVRSIYERDPRSRDDLQLLGALLDKEGRKPAETATTGDAVPDPMPPASTAQSA